MIMVMIVLLIVLSIGYIIGQWIVEVQRADGHESYTVLYDSRDDTLD